MAGKGSGIVRVKLILLRQGDSTLMKCKLIGFNEMNKSADIIFFRIVMLCCLLLFLLGMAASFTGVEPL
jgi:hypothetical protein